MFQPPREVVTVRGSLLGPLSAYWLFVLALPIIVFGLARSNPMAALVIAAITVAVALGAGFFAQGTRIEVGPKELLVAKRFRPTWRVPVAEFRQVVENIPSRPRMTALAGWTFHATSTSAGERRARVEIAMFAPAQRRQLRKLFRDVIVDADAALRRR